ncbi:hypothetical protein F4781DRAFT_439465, partial [Annulohypoxylon bovei var. microspora]
MASSQGEASTSTIVEPGNQSLPPELFIVLLENMPDYMMPYVWCNFRSVCKAWKAEIEKVFRKEYLPKTTIFFQLRSTHFFQSHLIFDRFSDKDTQLRAIFHPHPFRPWSPDLWKEIRNMVSNMKPTVRRPLREISGVVTVENVAVGDPAMEGLEVHYTNEELSMLWKPVMSQLMGDEVRLRREACKIIEEQYNLEKKSEANNTKPNPETESEAKTQDDNTRGTKRNLDPDNEPQAKRVKLDPDMKPEAKAAELDPDSKPKVLAKKVALYFFLRSSTALRAVMAQVRESRLRKQYTMGGEVFKSAEDHDGVPSKYDIDIITREVRKGFRSSAYFMEL